MTPRKWLDGHPWDGNGGAFGELACWRISLLLWSAALCTTALVVWMSRRSCVYLTPVDDASAGHGLGAPRERMTP